MSVVIALCALTGRASDPLFPNFPFNPDFPIPPIGTANALTFEAKFDPLPPGGGIGPILIFR